MRKQLHFRLALIAALIFASTMAFAQKFETSKTLNKNAVVTANVLVDMKNHSGDLKFVTGDADRVILKTEVHVTTKTKEDADKLLKALDNFEFDLRGDRLRINTRFYSNMRSINGRTTMVLINGDKIRVQDFEIKHEITIPPDSRLELENKYSNVVLPSLNNECKLDLYSSKLNAADFGSEVTLKAKYSKIYLDDFGPASDLDLYDTDVEFKNAGNLEVNSKYSKLEGRKAGTLVTESYDDKFMIDEMTALKMNAKYSDLESEAALDQLELELYDSDIRIKSAKNMTFNGKYCGLDLGNVKTAKIDDCYDSDLSFGTTKSIQIGVSKYSSFVLDKSADFTITDSYDDDVRIRQLDAGFSGFALSGKYTKIQIDAGSADFRVDVAMKYGKVDLPNAVNITKRIEKNSDIELLGGDTGGKITLRGYDNTLLIK